MQNRRNVGEPTHLNPEPGEFVTPQTEKVWTSITGRSLSPSGGATISQIARVRPGSDRVDFTDAPVARS